MRKPGELLLLSLSMLHLFPLTFEVLCIVVQFTLCHVLKGNKPDFHDALTGEKSQPMYEEFLKLLGSTYKPKAIKGMAGVKYP